jgi:hypothetical protein
MEWEVINVVPDIAISACHIDNTIFYLNRGT